MRTTLMTKHHLLARVYVYEFSLAQRLEVDAHISEAFGRGVAAAPHSLPRRQEALGGACIGSLNKRTCMAVVGDRHYVTDDEFDACRALQVLDPVDTAVTCGNVDVINSIVGDNLAATI
jgi:hypothetical protein